MAKFIPSYQRVAQSIKELISTQNIETLPSERDLCDIFNTSRTTVRKALDSLVSERLIFKIENRGYFTSKSNGKLSVTTQNKSLLQNLNITDVSTEVLLKDILLADDLLAKTLKINLNEAVFHLKRKRTHVDGTIFLMETFVPLKLCFGIEQISIEHFSQVSFWDVLKSLNLDPTIKSQKISVLKVSNDDAEVLELKQDEPIMRSETLAYHLDTPLEYAIIKTSAYDVSYNFNY